MSDEFQTVFEDRRGSIPVRLEAAPRVDARGNDYAHYRLVASEGRLGAVIVATRGADILLVLSRRESAGRDLWELPRGAGDETDADVVETGRRELSEETGFRSTATLLGQYLVDSTIFPHRMGAVHCIVSDDGPAGDTDGEISEMRWVSRDDVRAMMADGTIADAHSLATLGLWFAREAVW